jgi:hypothetical protein
MVMRDGDRCDSFFKIAFACCLHSSSPSRTTPPCSIDATCGRRGTEHHDDHGAMTTLGVPCAALGRRHRARTS